MSDSLRPHGLLPTRLLCPWNFPGKNTGVGCHFTEDPLIMCIDLEKIISLLSFSLGVLLKIGVIASFSYTSPLSYE